MSGSRILRWVILAAAVPLVAAVVWQIAERRPAGSTDEAVESGSPGEAAGLDIFDVVGTTGGRREYLLRAATARGDAGGTQSFEGLEFLEIYRTDGRVIRVTGRGGTSPSGRLVPQGPEQGARVRIEGGVRLEEPDGPVVETEWLEFDQAVGLVSTDAPVEIRLGDYQALAQSLRYSTERRELRLEGGVHAQGVGEGDQRLDLRAPLAVYDLDTGRVTVPRTEAGGIVIRRGRERVSADEALIDMAQGEELDDEARLDGRVQGTLLPPGDVGDPVFFASRSMQARRRSGGGPLRAMVLRQGARVWWRNELGTVHTLIAEEVEATLDEEGMLREVQARGDADLTTRSPGVPQRRVTAPVLTSTLAPGPILNGARARGGVRYEGPGGLLVRADRAEQDATGRTALRGEGSGIPTILDAQRTVVAPEIDVLPGGHVVEARAGVETSLVAPPENGQADSHGLFDVQRPVQARSDELRLDVQSGDASFRGEVQVLQDDRNLRAQVLHLRENGAVTLAEGDVRVRMFRVREDVGRIPVLVDGQTLEYRRGEGLLRFSGDVHYQEESLTLDTPLLVGRMSEDGGFVWAEADGGVSLLARGRDETGRSVELDGEGDTLRLEDGGRELLLRGGESVARIVNRQTREELRGPLLRLFLQEDRILAGTPGDGGRTTIKKLLTEGRTP